MRLPLIVAVFYKVEWQCHFVVERSRGVDYALAMADTSIVQQTSALVRAAWAELAATEAYKQMQLSPEYEAWKTLNDALRKLEKLGNSNAEVTASSPDHPIPPAPQFVVPTRRLTQVGAARRALRLAGKPLSTNALVAKMEQIGHPVGGENPELNLSSALSRSDVINSVKIEGAARWWPHDLPLPADMAVDP